MRERAHEKGRTYQRATKRWLLSHSLYGYGAAEFGDAYDVTCCAAGIGGEGFDFSLKLFRGQEVQRLLYAECKYRDEESGRTDSEFAEYLCSVYRALRKATKDSSSKAQFLFITTVPPASWRQYLQGRNSFVKQTLEKANLAVDDNVVADVCSQSDIIVLGERLIEEAR